MAHDMEALEIADLEYDVGANAALEPCDAETSNEVAVIWFVTPK